MLSSSTHRTQRVGLLAITAYALGIAGCEARVEPVTFEPNLVQTMKYQIEKDIPMEQASQDSTWVVETMFGTPDNPKLPKVVTEDKDLSSIVSMDHLVRASGSPEEEGRGLFRLLCATCHGVTGNGRGPTGPTQVPYPRDYRMGIFKFKSTPRGDKPTREDLARVIRHGISGTNMVAIEKLLETERFRRSAVGEPAVSISQLSDEDIQALVDYVIYLSWRGELERKQIDGAILDGILEEEGGRIINSEFANRVVANPEAAKQEAELYKKYEEDWDYAEEYVKEIGDEWLEAKEAVVQVPDPPSGFPLAESYADVVKFRGSDKASEFDASVKRGQELFVGTIANCSKCHGETGLGNGQTADYDDWTKDWTTRVGLKPDNREALIPLLARGALPPLHAIPRNFAEGIFRGGSSSKDLYLRITQGIDGTPMPAVGFVEGQFGQDDVWHLINFIRSLQTAEAKPAGEAVAAPSA